MDLNELFTVEGHHISTFKTGDIIYRTKSVEYKKQIHHDNLPILIEVITAVDDSYRKEPIEFLFIKNNLIYLRSVKEDYFGKKRINKVLLERFAENWALYEIPDGLTIEDCVSDY